MSILGKINSFKKDVSKGRDVSGSLTQGASSIRSLLTGEVADNARINKGLAGVNQLKANIETGLGSTSRFAVYMTPPKMLVGNNMGFLMFRTVNAELPGINLNRMNVKPHGYGSPRSMPTNYTLFPDISITYMASADLREYKFFSAWLDGIVKRPGMKSEGNSLNRTHTVNYLTEYGCSMSVVMYSETGNPVYECYFKDLYPVNMQNVTLSWDNNNQIFQFVVTYAYSAWYGAEIRDSASSKFGTLLGGMDPRIGSGLAGALTNGFKALGIESGLPNNVFDAQSVLGGGGILNFV
jgi:hypothetical protein